MPEETRLSLQCQVDVLRIELDLVKEQYQILKNFTVESIRDLAKSIDEINYGS